MGNARGHADGVVLLGLVVEGGDKVGEYGHYGYYQHYYQANGAKRLGAQVVPGHAGEGALPSLQPGGLIASFQYFS